MLIALIIQLNEFFLLIFLKLRKSIFYTIMDFKYKAKGDGYMKVEALPVTQGIIT
ncbi:hypothetical protein JCM21738_4740 [Mesobacillus boroniphilus JCM 21738]|uniref:Uncharacterized protein n=1 Tax=Mesobacillus boroniphilus JCM 21738 TaxID=1294265 RepID=W4RVN7_9BACI|nr:hypothetical protein JCM21738_4740 [Mesobacillus boroniphilus JCM 21738]